MKKIAFIGSSGGNLFKQGGNDIQGMMKEILLQTRAAQMEVAAEIGISQAQVSRLEKNALRQIRKEL